MKTPACNHPMASWLRKPIIPAVWEIQKDHNALAGAGMIFLQGGELANLPKILDSLDGGPLARVPLILHIDLLAGLANDEAGLRYIAGLGRIHGVITVRHHLVPTARRLGLASIVRLFLHDSRAVDRGLAIIEKCEPDAIELLPGVAVIELASQFRQVPVPRIAGGLIRTPQLVRRILDTGCQAISTSNATLWRLNGIDPAAIGRSD
jgi:glycerol uptake operon antiterminator